VKRVAHPRHLRRADAELLGQFFLGEQVAALQCRAHLVDQFRRREHPCTRTAPAVQTKHAAAYCNAAARPEGKEAVA